MADIFSNLLKREGPVDVLLGGPEHRHKLGEYEHRRKMRPLEQERMKTQTSYYKQREETGGRASIDRLLTIIRNLGSDASPEFLDSALTFILDTDPGLAALAGEMQGKDIMGSRKGTIQEAEKMRIFRNSLLEPHTNEPSPENKELFDDISRTYRNMLNNLSSRYSSKEKAKDEFRGVDPIDSAIKAMGGRKTLPKAKGAFGDFQGVDYGEQGPEKEPTGYKEPRASTARPPLTSSRLFQDLSKTTGRGEELPPKERDWPDLPSLGLKRKKPIKPLDSPKTGDPAAIEAYRRLKKKWGEMNKRHPSLAQMVLQWRSNGMPYDIIEKILMALEQGKSMDLIIGAEDVKPYFKDYIESKR